MKSIDLSEAAHAAFMAGVYETHRSICMGNARRNAWQGNESRVSMEVRYAKTYHKLYLKAFKEALAYDRTRRKADRSA